MKKNSKDTKLSWNDYEIVDKNTGVIGILKNTTLLIREEGYGMIMNSRLYYIVDQDRLNCLLNKGLEIQAMGLFIILSKNILKKFNICLNKNDIPYSAKLIAKEVNKSTQQVRSYIRILIEQNILHEAEISSQKHLGKVLVINPYLIRKGRLIDDSLKGLFDDFCN